MKEKDLVKKVRELYAIAKDNPDQEKRLDARRKLTELNDKYNIINLNYEDTKEN